MNTETTDTIVQIGQRVYCALHWAGRGTVVRIHGQQDPESVGHMGGGVCSYGGGAEFDIVFDNGAQSRRLPECILRGIQWQIYDEIVDSDAVLDAIKAATDHERLKETQAKEQAEAHREAVDFYTPLMRNSYPKRTKADKLVRGKQISDHARAAANIRMELKAAFPDIKFSVKSSSFSMGDDVTVSWECGPCVDEVEAITAKYQHGRFDSMTDYAYNDKSAFGAAVETVLGRAKYVSCSRSFPDGTQEAIGRALCDLQGVEYSGTWTRGLFGENDREDLNSHVYRLLRAESFPPEASITGAARCPVCDGMGHMGKETDYQNCPRCGERIDMTGFVITYDAPEPIADAEAAATHQTPAGAAYDVQMHHHTKRGIDFWICVPVARLTRDEFTAERDRCKASGGWYSRKWGSTPGGFAFEGEADARAFAG